MALIRRSSSIAAGAANADQLTTDGIPLETRVATADGMLTLAATVTVADILLTLLINGQRVTIDAAPVIKATGPLIPDDVIVQVPVAAGDVISMGARSTAGGASVLFYLLDIP